MTEPVSTSLRERKKARTRRSIQDAALRLIAENGYEATTVEQIADEAEISQSTFFRYFPTKEDVVLTDDYDPILVAAIGAADPDLPPLEAVRASVGKAFAEIYERDHDTIYQRSRLLLNTPALRSRIYEGTREAQQVFGTAVAGRMGVEPGQLHVRVLVAATLAVMMTTIEAWVEGGGAGNLPALIDEALVLLQGDLDVRPGRLRPA